MQSKFSRTCELLTLAVTTITVAALTGAAYYGEYHSEIQNWWESKQDVAIHQPEHMQTGNDADALFKLQTAGQ